MKYGLAEWTKFNAVVTGAGVVRIWEMRRGYGAFQASGAGSLDAMEQLYHAEARTVGEKEAQRRSLARNASLSMAEEFSAGRLPLWRAVSGLMPGVDLQQLHPSERFGRMAMLVRAVERVVRFEWRQFRAKGHVQSQKLKVDAEELASSDEDGICGDASHPFLSQQDAGAPENDTRVSWWDPLRFVCAHFEMAYSALSRFSREVAGLSASDLTDRVKAEGLKSAFRADVKRWLSAAYAAHPEWKELEPAEQLEAAWDWVQKSRGRGRGSRASWACGHGFSSYTRFHRACLAAHGVSPIELERAVLEEVFAEGELRERGDEVSACGAELERAGGIQISKIKMRRSRVGR